MLKYSINKSQFQCRDSHLSILQVDLVAQNHKREVFRVSGTGLDQEFVAPGVEGFEGIWRGHIKHQDAAVGSAVESYAEGLEPLLTGRVPNLTQTTAPRAGNDVHGQGSSHRCVWSFHLM